MPRQHPHAVRFHSSQTDFTLRSKISFAVRQISLRVLFCTRRGWAVGVAALWGYYIKRDIEGGLLIAFTTTSAEVSTLEVCKPITNG